MRAAKTAGNFPARLSSISWRGAVYALLIAYLIWVLVPMLWVAYSSLQTGASGVLGSANYERAWREAQFADYFLTSAFITISSVAGILFLGAMCAYALSRFLHPLGGLVYWLFVAGLTIPVQLSIIPLFFEMRALGLLNSQVGLIAVYIANGLPFAVFVLAGFFRTLPHSLYEAALIDGASEWQAYWRVMLPLARPGLVTVGIFQFIGVWREYLLAFMLISSGGEKTLPLALANLSIAAQYKADTGLLFAGIVIVGLPVLVVYLFLQRRLIGGVTAGALKG